MMLDVFLGVLGALAVKEIYFELVAWFQVRQLKKERKDFDIFMEKLEDEEADDED